MESNEITMKIACSIEELCNILKSKNFNMVEQFKLTDKYMVPASTDIRAQSSRTVLSKAIIIRNFDKSIGKSSKRITIKIKNIDDTGQILNQNIYNCDVEDIDEVKKVLEKYGYYQIMEIVEEDIVYEKDGFEIAIKNVKDGENLIEVEINERYNSIEQIKAKLLELDLPLDYSNYFVKKAEIELNKIYAKRDSEGR